MKHDHSSLLIFPNSSSIFSSIYCYFQHDVFCQHFLISMQDLVITLMRVVIIHKNYAIIFDPTLYEATLLNIKGKDITFV